MEMCSDHIGPLPGFPRSPGFITAMRCPQSWLCQGGARRDKFQLHIGVELEIPAPRHVGYGLLDRLQPRLQNSIRIRAAIAEFRPQIRSVIPIVESSKPLRLVNRVSGSPMSVASIASRGSRCTAGFTLLALRRLAGLWWRTFFGCAPRPCALLRRRFPAGALRFCLPPFFCAVCALCFLRLCFFANSCSALSRANRVGTRVRFGLPPAAPPPHSQRCCPSGREQTSLRSCSSTPRRHRSSSLRRSGYACRIPCDRTRHMCSAGARTTPPGGLAWLRVQQRGGGGCRHSRRCGGSCDAVSVCPPAMR